MAIYCGVGKTLPRSCWGIWNHAVRGTDKKTLVMLGEDPGFLNGAQITVWHSGSVCLWNSHLSVFTSIYLLSRHSPSTQIWMPPPVRGFQIRYPSGAKFYCRILFAGTQKDLTSGDLAQQQKSVPFWNAGIRSRRWWHPGWGDRYGATMDPRGVDQKQWPPVFPTTGTPRCVPMSKRWSSKPKQGRNRVQILGLQSWIWVEEHFGWQWVPWSGGVILIHGLWVINYTQYSFLDFCWDVTPRLEYSKFQQDNIQCFGILGVLYEKDCSWGLLILQVIYYIYTHIFHQA